MATLSDALGEIAGVRDRLERDTAAMADRSSAQLQGLEEAIARVKAERDRTWIAMQDERVRLDRLGLDAERLDAEQALHRERATRIARQLEGQQRVIALVEAELSRARDVGFEAATAHVQARLRGNTLQRVRRAQLERSRTEIARSSAEQAAAVAAVQSASAEPQDDATLAEIGTRRTRVDAELASAREERQAIPSPDEMPAVQRVLRERIEYVDADIRRLERDRAALDAAEDDVRRSLDAHTERLASLRREADAARSRVLAAHRRFAILEQTLEEDEALLERAVIEAETASAEAALVVRDLEASLLAENVTLETMRREHDVVVASAEAAAERRDALRKEIAEELRLRALLQELATLEISLEAAARERDELDRIVGRMRAAAL